MLCSQGLFLWAHTRNENWLDEPMKNRRRAENLMSRVSSLGSKKMPVFTAGTGLSVKIQSLPAAVWQA